MSHGNEVVLPLSCFWHEPPLRWVVRQRTGKRDEGWFLLDGVSLNMPELMKKDARRPSYEPLSMENVTLVLSDHTLPHLI